MHADVRAAYLRRLGLDAEPPSAHALQRLHQRQVERVPYETLWIHLGQAWDIDVDAAAARIAYEGRGGYCFHLNGAFSALLVSLGYDVTRHVGGVHGSGGPSNVEMTNHLVLTVHGLTTDDNPSGTWYVDAGLGDALHAALPLVAGEYAQAPFQLALRQTADGVGDWHLTHDPLGTFRGMSWRSGRATMRDFAERHQWLSTAPESGFVRVVAAQRRDPDGVDILRGLVLSRVGAGTAPTEPLTDRRDWFAALADVFGLRFDGVSPAALDRLWDRSLAAHHEWEAAGRR